MRDKNSPFASHIVGFLAAKTLAPKSKIDYGRYLREFDDYTGHVSLEEALTIDNAARFIEDVRPRGLFAAHNAAMYLKSMATWIKKTHYLELPGGGSALAGLEAPQTPHGGREAFSDEQMDAIWKILDDRPNRDRERAKAYIWLLMATGLRRNEARQLALSDLHLDIEHGRSWVLVRWQTSKGSKQRKVRLDPAAAGPIHEYITDDRPTYAGPRTTPEPVFITEHGMPFTENGFGSWASRIADDIDRAFGVDRPKRRAGEPARLPMKHIWKSHLMRHTWATNYNRASRYTGLTAKDLMVEGGWAHIAIADRYMHERPWEEMLDVPTAYSELRRHRKATA